jgi:3',5'-cyclic AMP phosphodiesterase CpdA
MRGEKMKSLWFVHLSDPHLPDGLEALKKAFTLITEKEPVPSFIVITGDLTTQDHWTALKKLVDASSIPVYLVRGNHDAHVDPESYSFKRRLGYERYYHFEVSNYHFLVLDSSSANTHEGKIDPEQKHWLAVELQRSPRGTLHYLFMHHPVLDDPVQSRALIPELYLNHNDANELVRLGNDYNLKAIFTGHIHRNSIITQDRLTQISIASVSKRYPDYDRTRYYLDTYGTDYVWYKYLSWLNTIGQPPCFSYVNIDQNSVRVMWHYL